MTADRLDVHIFDRPAGTLSIAGEFAAPGDWRFAYAPEYLAAPDPVPISVSLPLREDAFTGAVVRNWFANLLPEGAVRQAIEERLRLPPRDDFALLAAIGGECAGAVRLNAPDARAPPLQSDDLAMETLLAAPDEASGEGVFALLGTPHRLSLAGAQDKIAVVREPTAVCVCRPSASRARTSSSPTACASPACASSKPWAWRWRGRSA